MKKLSKVIFLLLFFSLTLSYGYAELKLIEIKSNENVIRYPRLENIENKLIEDKINKAIYDGLDIQKLESALKNGLNFNAESEANMLYKDGAESVLSVLFTVEGKYDSFKRPSQKAICLNFDMITGNVLGYTDIFSDTEAASDKISEIIETWIEKTQITHLDFEGLLPAYIENIFLSNSGISIYYNEDSVRLLSDRVFNFSFYFYEIEGLLSEKIEKIDKPSYTLEDYVVQGFLTNIPVKLGDRLEDVSEKYKKLSDDEGFLSGTKVIIEDSRFRDIWLTSKDKSKTVDGIFARRMEMLGLKTGISTKEEVLKILGENTTITISEKLKEQYGVELESVLMYNFDKGAIGFFFNSEDILSAVYLE